MNFPVFQRRVAEALKQKLGEGIVVESNRIIKNNGVVLNGICIRKEGINVSPTIYLDDLFQEFRDGRTMNSILGQLIRVYERTKIKETVDMEFFKHFDSVRDKLMYRLVNYEKNREQLEGLPYVRFLDMAIVFACTVCGDAFSDAFILINREHCRTWGVNREKLWETALQNMLRDYGAIIREMPEVIKEMMQEQLRQDYDNFCRQQPDFDLQKDKEAWIEELSRQLLWQIERDTVAPMYVMGNRTKYYGAGTILYPGVLRDFAEKKRCSFYHLPCSVHEVILIPDRGREQIKELQRMVKEVNESELEPEEVLSASVYYYNAQLEKVTMLSEGKIQ